MTGPNQSIRFHNGSSFPLAPDSRHPFNQLVPAPAGRSAQPESPAGDTPCETGWPDSGGKHAASIRRATHAGRAAADGSLPGDRTGYGLVPREPVAVDSAVRPVAGNC